MFREEEVVAIVFAANNDYGNRRWNVAGVYLRHMRRYLCLIVAYGRRRLRHGGRHGNGNGGSDRGENIYIADLGFAAMAAGVKWVRRLRHRFFSSQCNDGADFRQR